MNTKMLQVQEVPFHEQAVLMGQEKDGEVLVPIKRLCENLGIDYANQFVKVSGDARFNCCDITIVAPDGKKRRMVCLPVNQLSGWLFSISAKKVSPAVRDKLVLYQRECVRVLDSYWRKGAEARIQKLEEKLKYASISWELIDMQDKIKELTTELKKGRRDQKALPAPELTSLRIPTPLGGFADPVLIDYVVLQRIFKFAQKAGLGYPTSFLHDLLDRNDAIPTFQLSMHLPGISTSIIRVTGKGHPGLLT
jgi:hypothetical protein